MSRLASFQEFADFLDNRGKAADPARMPGKLQLQVTEAQGKVPSEQVDQYLCRAHEPKIFILEVQ